MTNPTAPFRHEPGIYFGLDDVAYHADDALGSSDIKMILKHPADYWWASWRNPARPERRETDYLDWGSAFHVLICEGPAAFERRYYRGPAKEDHKGALVTIDDLKKWLDQKGMAVSGTKDALIKRALGHDENAPIWDEIVRKAAILAGERLVLKPQVYDSVQLSSLMITKSPYCKDVFTNGFPEVSIFWVRDGVRCKMRVDYLRHKALVDLKSIRNWRSKDFDAAIKDAIEYEKYDVQYAHYVDGRSHVPEFVAESKVFGKDSEVPSKAWLDRLAAAPPTGWIWVFYQAEGAPITRRVEPDYRTNYAQNALLDVSRAIREFRHYSETFEDGIWVDLRPSWKLADEDLRSSFGAYARGQSRDG